MQWNAFYIIYLLSIQKAEMTQSVFVVNGGWAMWSSMSACSAACGKAQMTRTRECSNPKPAYGGIRCIGSKMEETDCNLLPCPRN